MGNSSENSQQPIDAETLFRRHAAWIARYVTRLGFRGQDVDDLVQDVFLVAHRRGGYQPGAAKPTTWLAEIALRTSLARRRKAARVDVADPETLQEVPAVTASPAARAQSTQALSNVQRALDTLDLDKRSLFILFELEGESCDSLAAAFDVPVGTIYSRLHATRRAFMTAYAKITESPTTPQVVP